jgi:hypothetical protein
VTLERCPACGAVLSEAAQCPDCGLSLDASGVPAGMVAEWTTEAQQNNSETGAGSLTPYPEPESALPAESPEPLALPPLSARHVVRTALIIALVGGLIAVIWYVAGGRRSLQVSSLEKRRDAGALVALYNEAEYRPLVLAALGRLNDPVLAPRMLAQCQTATDWALLEDAVGYLLALDQPFLSGLIETRLNAERVSDSPHLRIVLLRRLARTPAAKARLTAPAAAIVDELARSPLVGIGPKAVTRVNGRWEWSIEVHDVSGRTTDLTCRDVDIYQGLTNYYSHGESVTVGVPANGSTSYSYWCQGDDLKGGIAHLTLKSCCSCDTGVTVFSTLL